MMLNSEFVENLGFSANVSICLKNGSVSLENIENIDIVFILWSRRNIRIYKKAGKTSGESNDDT